MEKRTLTTGEVAEYCGVNFRTVIRWIDRGLIKAYKLPGRGDNRIRTQDFMTFLHENEIPVPEELRPRSKSILIVEDDPALAASLRRLLTGAGYETAVATDGFSAGAMVGTLRPALVTLDLMLPGIKGVDVLRFIRSTPSLQHVKILVVSGQAKPALDEALAAGADDALSKPYDRQELLARVARLLPA